MARPRLRGQFGKILSKNTPPHGKMIQITALVVLVALIGSSYGMNCTGYPDGNYEIACRSFATCTNGQVKIKECDHGLVYNSKTGACDDPDQVPAPCGNIMDCSGKADGRYPDASGNCHSFYTCTGHEFIGHQICPARLVFNEELQACDWATDVNPPCGTKGQK